MDSSTTRRSMESILSKTIQLNNAGVVCLVENNNIEKAVKLFAMAFSNHEKLKLQANRMIITSSSSSSRTTATAFNESSSPSPTQQQQQQQQRSRSTKKQPQHQQLNDLFVRYRHRSSSSSSSEEDDNDVVFRDLIRLPSIEDIIVMMKCTNNNNSNSNNNAHNNNNNNTEEIEEHEYSQIIGFLSTCHTYNLALAHHLCGLELLRSTTSSSSSSSSSDRNTHIFDRAGRLYELTMRLERTRSKLRQQQKQNSDDNNNSNNDINTWFTPQILLACLNNLAHLHYRTNNHIRSRTCYLQVQITTKKLWDLKRQQRQGKEEEEEEGINTNNNDDCDDDDDDGIGNNYFSVFWTNACRGLSRLIASSSSSRASPRSNNNQQHYVTKSSAAAAA